MAEAADAPTVRYQTVRRLAVGGMGEIFLARERGRLGFSRLVVIKRMLPELARRRDFVDMFVDEARIVGHLSHPNICQILELGEEDGVPFLALEYVRGDSLSGIWDRAHAGGSSVPRAVTLRILADTAWALHYAHEACDADGQPLNVIHRDISPHNVMVSFFGDVKLMDFGIARADNRMHRTDTGKVKGKIAYMAPEQLRGQPLDRRADVFAVGVMLWELTLSRRLFGGGGEVETLQKAIACEVPRPRTIDPTYPEELEAIVMRALASNRDARTATAGELAEALRGQLAKLGGAERVDLAALMTRLYPTESAAGDDVIPTLSWIDPVDTEIDEEPSSSANEAGALAPRPTVPLKTPTPHEVGAVVPRPTVPLKTPTPHEVGEVVPRPTAPMRTPSADGGPAPRPAGNTDDDPRPTLPQRASGTADDARPTLPQRAMGTADDARPTLPLRTRDADDARPTLPLRTRDADDARPTLPQRAMGTADDARPTLPQRATGIAGVPASVTGGAVSLAGPRRARWGLGVAAVFVVAGAAIAIGLASRGDSPGRGDVASTTGSAGSNAESAHEVGASPTVAMGDVAGGRAATGGAANSNAATGSEATGNAATGTTATGTAVSGNAATGNAATSSAARGSAATGNAATSSVATGTTATGARATGVAPTGTTATSTTATGTAPTSNATGNAATGSPATGDVATGHSRGASGHGGAGNAHPTRHGGGSQASSAATATSPASGTGGITNSTSGAGGITNSTSGAGTSPSTSGTSASSTTAAAAKTTGTLAVASDQTGVVSIDGVRAKSTPYQTEVATGDHRVEVELAEGAGTLRASARVVAGSKTKCRVEKGALACVVSPR